jgi:hypothetical protein
MMLRLAGAALSAKPGAAFTVRLSVSEVDNAPAVPVTVTVLVAGVAADVALNVSVLEAAAVVAVVVAGLNEAVTPLGSPLIVSATALLKPLVGVTVMVSAAVAPWTTLTVGAEALTKKPAGGVTVRVIATVALRVPDLPVTVTAVVPIAALALAVKVSVLAVVALAGLNDAVTPLGSAETVRLTAPVNPYLGAMVMVFAAVDPWATLTVEAEEVNEKLAGGVTVRVIATVALRVPDLPVTVTAVLPATALALAVNVKVLAVAVLAGLNDAVTPVGTAEMVRLTTPVNPYLGATAIDAVPVPACGTLTVEAVVVRLKAGTPVTWSVIATLEAMLPETP